MYTYHLSYEFSKIRFLQMNNKGLASSILSLTIKNTSFTKTHYIIVIHEIMESVRSGC